jgi:hypothetical protein
MDNKDDTVTENTPVVVITPPKRKPKQRPVNSATPPEQEREMPQATQPAAKQDKKDKKDDSPTGDIKFITDKFEANLTNIGDILKNSVEAQNKAFKGDLDQVDKTYSQFVNSSADSNKILEKASEEQKEVFKGLTDAFIQYRQDENADAEKFHKDLTAIVKDIHAADGDEGVKKYLESLATEGRDSSKVDPNRAKNDRKWKASKNEQDSLVYRMFAGNKKPKQDEFATAKALGEAEKAQKGLFGGKSDEKSSLEKMVEGLVKHAEKNKGLFGGGKSDEKSSLEKMVEGLVKHAEKNKGSGMSDKMEKLTISNLIVEKVGGKLGDMLERIGNDKKEKESQEPEAKVHHKNDDAEDAEYTETLRTKPKTDAEDAEYTETLRTKPKTDAEDAEYTETLRTKPKTEAAPILLGYSPKPEQKEVETRSSKSTGAKLDAIENASHAASKELHEFDKNVSEGEKHPTETSMSKAIKGALSSHEPIEAPNKTLAGVAMGKLPSASTASTMDMKAGEELEKEPDAVAAAPEAKNNDEKDEGGGIMNTLGDLAEGGLSKAGGLLKGAGKLAGKVAAPLAAGLAVFHGVSDIADGGKVDSIIPKGGLMDKLNPFEYAMNGGRIAGQGINSAYEGASKMLGGSGSIGSDIFDHFGKHEKTANEITAEGVAAYKAKKAASSGVAEVSNDAQTAKDDAAAQPAPPVIITNNSTTAAPASSGGMAAPTVTASPRDRENYFTKTLSNSFTAM